MKPLILEFAEVPELKHFDYSLIEYSYEKNLSVIKNTQIPAISCANMDTETETKTIEEPTDSDYDFRFKLKRLLDTSTETFTTTEPSDSDDNYSSLKLLLDTHSITKSIKPIDLDV